MSRKKDAVNKDANYYQERKDTNIAKMEYIRTKYETLGQQAVSFTLYLIKLIGLLVFFALIVLSAVFLVKTIRAYFSGNEVASVLFNILQFITSGLSIAIGIYGLYMSWKSSKEASVLWGKVENAFVNKTLPNTPGRVYKKHEENTV